MFDRPEQTANREWRALCRRGPAARLWRPLQARLPDVRGAHAGQDQAVPDRGFPKAYVVLEWLLSSVAGIEYPALVYRVAPKIPSYSRHSADFRLPDQPHAGISRYGRQLHALVRVAWQ